MKNQKSNDVIYGRWPVLEGLQSNAVTKILISRRVDPKSLDEILKLAKAKKIPFVRVDKLKLDSLTKGNHQGVVGYVSVVKSKSLDSVLDEAVVSQTKTPALIFLDGIQDPQNVGTILRSAVYFGVKGVIIPKWRSSPLIGSVVRASAGAAKLISIVQVSNLATAMREARKKGLWLVGADMDGEPVVKATIPRPFGLVMGSEGDGLHRLVKENCDVLVSISGAQDRKGIDSLNVSVACGVLLHSFS